MFKKNLKQNHAKHEKCSTSIKQTSMALMVHGQIIGGGAPTIRYLWWRGPASSAL